MEAMKGIETLVKSYEQWKAQRQNAGNTLVEENQSLLDLIISRVGIYYSEKVSFFMKKAIQEERLSFRGDKHWFYSGTFFSAIMGLLLSGRNSDNYQQLVFELISQSDTMTIFNEPAIISPIVEHFLGTPRSVVSELMVEFLFQLVTQHPADDGSGTQQWLPPLHPLVAALIQNISGIANRLNGDSLSLRQKRSLLPFIFDLFANHSAYADTIDLFANGDCPSALINFMLNNENCNIHHLWITGIFDQFFYFFPDSCLITLLDRTSLISVIHTCFQPTGKKQLRGPMTTIATTLCMTVEHYPNIASHIAKKKSENQKFNFVRQMVEEERLRKENQLLICGGGGNSSQANTKAFEID
eukprot:TRINITY_DN4736_c0_g1_i4.p1 TRINITY_DN4736_c0_g1~~TRINITY_DN4736_c0_g1_i4.p1  ORF type:complete len:356 (-),score=67.92 TRINITY_DN4736_c0_g1_i4:104-1171(-)